MINFYIVIIMSVVIVLAILLDRYVTLRRKTTRVSISRKNGWNRIKLNDLIKDPNFKYILNKIKIYVHSDEDKEMYIKRNFLHIHFYSNITMLEICRKLHVGDYESDEEKLRIKRWVSVSSILYNFSVPGELFIYDSTVVEMVCRYMQLTSLFGLDRKKVIEYTGELRVDIGVYGDIKKTMQGIVQCNTWIAKIGEGRYPNSVHLLDLIKRTDKVLFGLVDGDIIKLKRVLTVCGIINGIDIPIDWICIDDYCVQYIQEEKRVEVIEKKKNHLRVVR